MWLNFHRLYIYDDLMYAYYPAKKLPVVDKKAKATFKNGIRFEVNDVNDCGLQTLFKQTGGQIHSSYCWNDINTLMFVYCTCLSIYYIRGKQIR